MRSKIKWATIPLALVVLALPAEAGPILNYQYTGVVVDAIDAYGIFEGITPGDPVSGTIRYGAPVPQPIDFGGLFQYTFPVTPAGNSLITVMVGGLDVQSTQQLIVQNYQPVSGFVGVDFQFADADTSQLSVGSLPPGYSLTGFGAYIGIFVSDPSLSTYPNLPTSLPSLPLALPFPDTVGFLFVDIRDAAGQYVDSAFVGFALASLTAVPEPSSIILLGSGTVVTAAFSRRLRRLITSRCNRPRQGSSLGCPPE